MQKPIALVTGGSRGIGAAICHALARDGYHVLVHYGASADKARDVAAAIGGEVIQADLTKDDDIHAMVSQVQALYGKLDVLVNNAGIAECEDLEHLTRDGFFRTMQINLWAPMLLTQLCVPLMTRGGSITFLSSTCAQHATPDALAYAASKAGGEIVMRSLTPGLAPSIRVNAVAPAATDTDMMRTNYTDEDRQWLVDNNPMRCFCDRADIAEMVAFLVSDKARNITGQVFTVDAGRMSRAA